MTTFRIRHLLIALAAMFTCVNAQAQYSGEIHQDGCYSDFSSVSASFNLTDVATTLGTDTATLVAALNSDQGIFYLVDPADGQKTNSYTGNSGEFWLDRNGSPAAYENGSFYFVGSNADVENDLYNIYMGQYPDSIKAGFDITTTVALVYGDKEATFAIHYTVDAEPVAPEPATLKENELNIVGSAALTVHQYPRTDYTADAVGVEVKDMASALGVDSKDLTKLLKQILYAPEYDTTYGSKKDSLTKKPTATAPGWWFRQGLNEQSEKGNEASATSWGSDDCFYLEAFAFANDTLTCNFGQYPSSCAAGDSIFTNVYVIYGDKAYKVTYTLIVDEAPYAGLEDMTLVGNTDIEVSQEVNTDYEAVAFDVPIDDIATAMGVDKSNISMQVIGANGGLDGKGSTNLKDGFWMTIDGVKTSWGSNAAMYVDPKAEGDYSQLYIGQYPNGIEAGTTVNFKMYLVSGEKYWTLSIAYTVTEKQTVEYAFESVATRNVIVQQLANDGYVWSDKTTLPMADMADLIGTDSPVLYAIPDSTVSTTDKYSKKYTMTAEDGYIGFWVTKDGYNRAWGDASLTPWGMEYKKDGDNCLFACMAFPANGVVGNSWTGEYYLVNEENNKMVTIKLTYQIVDALVTYEEVGAESVSMPVSLDDNAITVDLSKAATALGYETVDAMLEYGMRGLNGGVYSELQATSNGCNFSLDGNYDAYGDINIKVQKSGDEYQFVSYSNSDIEEGYSKEVSICFEKDTQRYIFHINLMDETTYQGISEIVTDNAKAGKIFDLSGRQINKPVKGLYIMNGKKYMIK